MKISTIAGGLLALLVALTIAFALWGAYLKDGWLGVAAAGVGGLAAFLATCIMMAFLAALLGVFDE